MNHANIVKPGYPADTDRDPGEDAPRPRGKLRLTADRPTRKRKASLAAMLLLAVGLAGGTARAAPEELAKQIEALTGGRTKIVWDGYRDDPSDDRHGVVAYDTADGRSRMLSTTEGFWHPFITPDGEQVIYNTGWTPPNKGCSIVNWDGTNERWLVRGEFGWAHCAWRDPATGYTWIYVSDANRKGGSDVYDWVRTKLFRVRLDKPEIRELVSEQVGSLELYVSPDGKRGLGGVPGPFDQSILDFATGLRTPVATGCSASYSRTDDRFMIMAGNHRQVHIYDWQDGQAVNKRVIQANTMPLVNGRQNIWHARWSNHPRVFSIMGPENPDFSEIHLGRLNQALTAVEAWVQVTNNRRKNERSNVWVEQYAPRRPKPAAAAATNPWAPVFDVPRLKHIAIDGDAADWGEAGFRVELLAAPSGRQLSPQEFAPSFRLGWDDDGLLVMARVTARAFHEADQDDDLSAGAGLELYLAPAPGAPDLIRATIAPGMDAGHPQLRLRITDLRKTAALKRLAPAIKAASARIPGGYVVEARLPWAALGIKPRLGREAGFQLDATHKTAATNSLFRATWYPQATTAENSMAMHRLRLAEQPSPAIRAFIQHNFLRPSLEPGSKLQGQIFAAGTPDLAGRQVQLERAGHVVATAPFSRPIIEPIDVADDPLRRAYPQITFTVDPPPKGNATSESMRLLVDGVPIAPPVYPFGSDATAR